MNEEVMKIKSMIADAENALGIEDGVIYNRTREWRVVDMRRVILFALCLCGFPNTYVARSSGFDHASVIYHYKQSVRLLSIGDKVTTDNTKKLLRLFRDKLDLEYCSNRFARKQFGIDVVKRLLAEIDEEDKQTI